MGVWTTPVERQRMLAERREGLSFGRIARKWGYSPSGVHVMVRKAEAEERRERDYGGVVTRLRR